MRMLAPDVGAVVEYCGNRYRVDAFTRVFKDKRRYAPTIDGLGGGDYVEFEVDLDTGKIIDLASRQKIIQALTD